MKISACYIVKNEEKNISKSIESLKDAADEIIVVDTGSEDNTCALAEELGARLYHFQWIDDFAAAKNFALSKAVGEWVLFLDGDEYFCHPDRVRAEVEKLISSQPDMDGFQLRRKNVDGHEGGEALGDSYCVRLFRNTEDIRFVGRIHENINHRRRDLRIGFAGENLDIWHTGYSRDIIEKKIHRNLKLLKAVEKRGTSGGLEIYLADCYFGLREYGTSYKYAMEAIANEDILPNAREDMFRIAIESMRKLNLPDEDMLIVAEAALLEFSDIPDYHAQKGMILCGLGRLQEAEKSFAKALDLWHNPRPVEYGTTFNEKIANIVEKHIGEIHALEQNNKTQEDKPIYISACYIVKNEEDKLSQSLKSIQGLFDELIVTDTGSTDGTCDIARAYGAKIYHHEWKSDFSDARNFTIEKAQGRWILFLDADEYFTPETAGNLRRVLEEADRAEKKLLLIQWRNIDADTGEHLVDVYTPRVFRNLPELRYEGRIHEQLKENGGDVANAAAVPDAELLLIHTGYSSSIAKSKAKRNLELLLKEIESSKEPEKYYMAIAESYEGIGDKENAIKYAEMDIKINGRQSINYASRSHRLLIKLYRELNQVANYHKVAKLAVEEFPELPEFHAEYAECIAAEGRYSEALNEGKLAEKCYDDFLNGKISSLEPVQFDSGMLNTLEQRMAMWKENIDLKESHKPIQETKTHTPLKITACLIFKNDIRDMEAWLKNTEVYADSRVLVDTGSTDGSRALVEKSGCRVIDFPWNGSFADARNFALNAVKNDGGWITFTDADEIFETPETLREHIEAYAEGENPPEALSVYISNIDEDNHNREKQHFYNVRIFKNTPELRYHGSIHENLVRVSEGLNLPEIARESRIRVLHKGYSSGRIAEKSARNLQMLLKDIEIDGENKRHYHYLAEAYIGTGQYEKALKYSQIALDTGDNQDAGNMLQVALESLRALNYPLGTQLETAKRGMELLSEIPDYYAETGIIEYDLGHRVEATEHLTKALELESLDQSGEAAHFAILKSDVYAILGEISLSVGEAATADNLCEKALNESWENRRGLNLYRNIHADLSPVNFIENVLEKIGDSKEHRSILTRWSLLEGHWDIYKELIEQNPDAKSSDIEMLQLFKDIHDGRYHEVYNQSIDCLVGAFYKLVVSILKSEEIPGIEGHAVRQRCISLLPEPAGNFMRAYFGDESVEISEERFNVVEPYILEYGSEKQIGAMASVLTKFSLKKVKSVAKKAMEKDRYQGAFELLSAIPADSPEADGEFWGMAGICLYQMGEYESAMECISRAEAHGDISLELKSYKAWIEERGAE